MPKCNSGTVRLYFRYEIYIASEIIVIFQRRKKVPMFTSSKNTTQSLSAQEIPLHIILLYNLTSLMHKYKIKGLEMLVYVSVCIFS